MFIKVAESIVILPPMSQVGWASASSMLTRARSAWLRPRKGPPEAVSTKRSIVPGLSLEISWNSAECSLSTGMMRAPVASASAVTSSPPTTRLSLLARARSMPSPRAAIVGPSPAEPIRPFSTRSQSVSVISSIRPSAPPSTWPSAHSSEALAAAVSSASATRSTR